MATTSIPAFPQFHSDAVVVSPAALDDLAGSYCASTASPSALDFFYSYLPLTSVAQVFQPQGSTGGPTLAQLFGNIYVSGYFGGAWLAQMMPHGSAPDWLEWLITNVLEASGSQKLADYCQGQVTFAQTGASADVLASLPQRISNLLWVCSYDAGFLQELIADAPSKGLLPQVSFGRCLLDFSCADVTVATDLLTHWNAAVPHLLNPPAGNLRWLELAARQTLAAKFESSGTDVWSWLLNHRQLPGDAYVTVFDLGVKYQLLGQTVTLAGMSAWANEDVALARLSILLETCFILWSAAYLIGLFSGNTTQPGLEC